jgi:hypothetical protein
MPRKRTTYKRSKKPVGIVILINIVAYGAGYFTCYWFVSNYNGSMPPPGTFDDFIKDSWGWLTTGFLGPVFLTLLTRWALSKFTRREDDV